MIVISPVVGSFPIPPAAAWINAAFSALSHIILSFLQGHVCPVHAAEPFQGAGGFRRADNC